MTRSGLLSLLLTLNLGLSALGFGMARGQVPVAGQMVICTGNGIVTLSVDADGNPVASHTLCPDAALGFWAPVAVQPPAAPRADLALLWHDWPQSASVAVAAVPRNRSARAPPV
ncbi:hypothetical protein SAMN04488094_10472 [Tropicimonas isoalkanivorans]|uniref:DUF2946 domain-containing protein n=2 Tax=Tropicimonas isoalkanivorans TaxID=441112 RepID=A0A1I1IFJ4_9RHOB|nr:hypothetical protein SAMN04488094_10472 [Tropicimonas isoalkanivorans]